MSNKLIDKLADFMGDEKAAEEFVGSVNKRQKEIEDKNMITRGKDGEKEKELDGEKDVEEVNQEEIEVVEISLSEELASEMDERAKNLFDEMISPVNGIINEIKETYEKRIASLEEELKTIRGNFEALKKVSDKVEEVIEQETPTGRRKVVYDVKRPSVDRESAPKEDEEEYVDTVEMRDARFAKFLNKKK